MLGHFSASKVIWGFDFGATEATEKVLFKLWSASTNAFIFLSNTLADVTETLSSLVVSSISCHGFFSKMAADSTESLPKFLLFLVCEWSLGICSKTAADSTDSWPKFLYSSVNFLSCSLLYSKAAEDRTDGLPRFLFSESWLLSEWRCS